MITFSILWLLANFFFFFLTCGAFLVSVLLINLNRKKYIYFPTDGLKRLINDITYRKVDVDEINDIRRK